MDISDLISVFIIADRAVSARDSTGYGSLASSSTASGRTSPSNMSMSSAFSHLSFPFSKSTHQTPAKPIKTEKDPVTSISMVFHWVEDKASTTESGILKVAIEVRNDNIYTL
jgi:hypothetical protein